MSRNFNWQTEEDYNWDNTPEPPQPPPKKGARWPWVLLILIGFSGLGWLIYRQIDNRITLAQEAIQADVISSHTFINNIDDPSDLELFITFLSGRDPDWADEQEHLLTDNLLFNYPLLGIERLPGAIYNAPPQVTLDPSLKEAELVSDRPYAIDIGNGITKTIHLSQTAVYRLGPNRWLYAPPNEIFWGSTENLEYTWLTADFPNRDTAIVTQLTQDINAKIGELCRLPSLTCSPDSQIHIHFATEPSSLDPGQIPVQPATNTALELALPTPTLIGLPTDNDSYQALYRGYASLIVTTILKSNQRFICCQQASFHDALIDTQLYQLALKPWPLTPEHYQQLSRSEPDLFDLTRISTKAWGAEYEPQQPDWLAYALVDFIRQEISGASPLALQTSLTAGKASDNFLNWMLADNFPPEQDVINANQLWQTFLSGQLKRTAASSPPTADLYLACTMPPNIDYTLYQYQFERATWQQNQTLGPNRTYLSSTPQADGLFVSQIQGTEVMSHYWADGQQTAIQTSGLIQSQTAIFLGADPTNQHLLFFTDSSSNKRPYELLDWNQCQAGECQLQPLEGYPYWSPSGETALLFKGNVSLENSNRGFWALNWYENDAQTPKASHSQQLVDPFWLDNETLGYIVTPIITYTINEEERQLYTTGITSINTDMISQTQAFPLDSAQLTLADLEAQVAPDRPLGYLRLQDIQANPQKESEFILITFDSNAPDNYYLFKWDWPTNSTALIATMSNVPRPLSYAWSPHGRYLALITNANNGFDRLQIYDQQTEQLSSPHWLQHSTPFPHDGTLQLDWSPDGEWLAFNNGSYAHLIAPGDQQHRLIPYAPNQTCTTVAWANDI